MGSSLFAKCCFDGLKETAVDTNCHFDWLVKRFCSIF